MELAFREGIAAKFIADSGVLDSPFVLVDIGVRGGIHPRWRPFESAMEVYGFDATADVPMPNPRHHYFKTAIGNYDGECLFHIPDNLYEARISPNGTEKIPIAKLDTLWAKQVLPPADFIKIDCEGHEPEILAGAEIYLGASNVLGADVETNFHISPTLPLSHFGAIHEPLLRQRLLVADFAFGAASRLSWCGTCNVLFGRHFIDERHHQDNYKLRSPETEPSADTILKTIAVFDVYALYGPATALVQEFRDVISDRIDAKALYNKLLAFPTPSLAIERFIPHLGLGLWTRAKRLALRRRAAL
jgi:hypothetical protein